MKGRAIRTNVNTYYVGRLLPTGERDLALLLHTDLQPPVTHLVLDRRRLVGGNFGRLYFSFQASILFHDGSCDLVPHCIYVISLWKEEPLADSDVLVYGQVLQAVCRQLVLLSSRRFFVFVARWHRLQASGM